MRAAKSKPATQDALHDAPVCGRLRDRAAQAALANASLGGRCARPAGPMDLHLRDPPTGPPAAGDALRAVPEDDRLRDAVRRPGLLRAMGAPPVDVAGLRRHFFL